MKKTLAFLLALFLLAGSAAAEVDLSGMTFDELVALKDQINQALWSSKEWQEVTVPAGIWTVGKDIPAGSWTIRTASDLGNANIYYFRQLDAVGMGPDYMDYFAFRQIIGSAISEYNDTGIPVSLDLDLQSGWYFQTDSAVIFTPFAGKPDLGFK